MATLRLVPGAARCLTACCDAWGAWLTGAPEATKRGYALDAGGGGGWVFLAGKDVFEVALGGDLALAASRQS